MRTIASLSLALWLLPAALTAAVRELPEPGEPLVVVGRITELDRVQRSFTVDSERDRATFHLAEGAQVTGNGVELGFDALDVGQRVAVEAIPNGGFWLASSVEIVGAREIAAQLPEEAPATNVAEVTVTAVDVAGRRLHVESTGGPLFYRVPPEAHIERDGAAIQLEDLSVGERVMVSADETRPGAWTARSITVLSPEPTPAADASTSR